MINYVYMAKATVLAACVTLVACGADPGASRAVAILKKMTSAVAALPEFKLTMETGFDVLQPNGEQLAIPSSSGLEILVWSRHNMHSVI